MSSGPLEGIRVLDLSIAGTGPYAAVMLADQGADVIKVERPGSGDIGRWVGVTVNGVSALFQMCNRSKRSIALDLSVADGVAVLVELARTADVVIENFRPGVVDRLGVGYEALRQVRPELVYVSISGFGASGPYAAKSAYDTVIQAYAGLAVNQADLDTGEPQFINQVVADKVTALHAAQAVAAALFARERGRGGQHIQLAMLDAVVAFLWTDAAGNEMFLDADGSAPSNLGRLSPLRFLDGWGIVTPTGDADFAGMCRAFEVEGYDDPRVATTVARGRNRDAARAVLGRCAAVAATLTTRQAMDRLEAHRVPCGVVLSAGQLPDDPQARHTGLFVESVHPAVGRLRQPRHAARFSGTPVDGPGLAPGLGQHTDEVLTELGREADIVRLRAAGVVA